MEHGRHKHRQEAGRAARRRIGNRRRASTAVLTGAAVLPVAQMPLSADAGRAILGTRGRDTLWGTNGDNRIYGGRSADRIYARDGEDVVRGGTGRHILDGGGGGDVLQGDEARDRTWGDVGDDRVKGGTAGDHPVVRGTMRSAPTRASARVDASASGAGRAR